jgi:WD40 repeat protein
MVWPRANYVFTCDWDGILKQFSLSDFSLYRTFNKVIKKGARKMCATKNSRHLFIGDLDGFIKHYTFEEDGDLKHRNFFRDHESAIRAMALTHDDQFLFTASHCGQLKQHYIHPAAKCLMKRKDWSDIFVNNSSILCLVISLDNEYLFMGDKDGH